MTLRVTGLLTVALLAAAATAAWAGLQIPPVMQPRRPAGATPGPTAPGGTAAVPAAPAPPGVGGAARSQFVYPGANGRLVYVADKDGNRLPDFSWCGYMGGGVTLPDVAVRLTVEPAATGDDTARLQDAINKVSALPLGAGGFRGAILLKKGTYRIAGTLKIAADGVVLRGEGQGERDTVLIATGATQRTLISFSGGGRASEVRGSRQAVADASVPLGARTITLASAAGFKPGDRIIVLRPSVQAWFDVIGANKLENPWQPGSKDLRFERTVTAVEGNRLAFDVPLCNDLKAEYGGGFVYKVGGSDRLRNVGIENLRGDSEYKGDTDEDHGWNLVQFTGVENGWAKDVTSLHFGYSCVGIGGGSRNITVEDCSCLDPISLIEGGRRYSFAVTGQMNLVQRCVTRHGRHDFVMHATVPGPNVFLDCRAEKAHSDTGPHHRWSCGTLYDNVSVSGHAMNVQNRGNSGTGHGWAGAYMVFWNSRADSIDCQKPPTAQNYAIGCITPRQKGTGAWDSPGRPVEPRSLYLAQLAERLGPQAVKAIAPGAPRPRPDMTPVGGR